MRSAGARPGSRAGLIVWAALALLGCSRHPGSGTTAAPSGPARHHVRIHGVRFDPDSLAVAVGDTVEWDNRDLVPHTSTAAGGAWSSGNIAPDSSWSTVIRASGALRYGCNYHPVMKGQIIAR